MNVNYRFPYYLKKLIRRLLSVIVSESFIFLTIFLLQFQFYIMRINITDTKPYIILLRHPWMESNQIIRNYPLETQIHMIYSLFLLIMAYIRYLISRSIIFDALFPTFHIISLIINIVYFNVEHKLITLLFPILNITYFNFHPVYMSLFISTILLIVINYIYLCTNSSTYFIIISLLQSLQILYFYNDELLRH